MHNVKSAEVYAGERLVGTLMGTESRMTVFEYSPWWLQNGFSISPFSLPLRSGLFTPKNGQFDYIPGVFDDCIPDGWGRLLTDRFLSSRGFDCRNASPMTRLCLLDDSSPGLLEFRPRLRTEPGLCGDNPDDLFTAARKVLADREVKEEELDALYRNGGSSGGARPKVNMTIDGDLWIVKFPASMDGFDAGVKEYECNQKAVDAGLDVAGFRLIESRLTGGFFASRRFDRRNGKRIHMISLSGLLESSHRIPVLDYRDLLKAAYILTKSEEELLEAFRRACFNVMIGNQDDHGKNFAFLYDEKEGKWHLSPAYDLTVSTTFYGEHSTSVCGKGKNITDDDLRRLADGAGIDTSRREEVIRDVSSAAGR